MRCLALEYTDIQNSTAGRSIDDDPHTYWAASGPGPPSGLIVEFQEAEFDCVLLQEPIHLGQRISKFKIWVEVPDGWREICEGSTIGHKRLIRIDPVRASRIRIEILAANHRAAISSLGLYKISEAEPNVHVE